MPELPEVEVTRRGVAPYLQDQFVTEVIMRRSGLRWPFPQDLAKLLGGQKIVTIGRRGKYLLINFAHGTVLIHLGMSGHLRILPSQTPATKHDHIDIVVGAQLMRMNDPRRFGAVLWHPISEGAVDNHLLLRNLGVEPLEDKFDAKLLYQHTRSRNSAIKQVLLAGDIVSYFWQFTQ